MTAIGDGPFILQDGILWRKTEDHFGEELLQLALPKQHRSIVLSLAHKPGYLGHDRTTQRITDEFDWPGVHSDVKKVCEPCPWCQKTARRSRRRAPLQPLPIMINHLREWEWIWLALFLEQRLEIDIFKC